MSDGLSGFHPLIVRWFRGRIGEPTEVQALSWPRIRDGENLLITAPTGTGKTLTAFLSALDRLVTGGLQGGAIRVLYISPLKALNTDIRENLLRPVEELRNLFASENIPFPAVRIAVRSGDTPREERRKMIKDPPEILITTPESLNLLLLSSDQNLFSLLSCVIVDEIHALLYEKRGTLLFSALERLSLQGGEFQRIALSATLKDPSEAAHCLGGFRQDRRGSKEPRPVGVIAGKIPKKLELSVKYLETGSRHGDENIWETLAAELRPLLTTYRSVLIFVNNRRSAERLALLLNEGAEGNLVYAHHGSLSREIRAEVEGRLKRGELRGIVATGSLELGIDIGHLDHVVLVETPFSVSSAVQRVGRAGHRIGVPSTGTLRPIHGRDLLLGAVMAPLMAAGDIEESRIPTNPFDVLAQIVLSAVVVRPWDAEDLFGFLRCIYPYRDLPRRAYENVLDMLAGKYASTRVRELRALLRVDPLDGKIQALSGARLALYSRGGAIPERGYFKLKTADSGAVLGEVDEEFVWERRIGDCFYFGTQAWKITDLDSESVRVIPWKGPVNVLVFWKGEVSLSSQHFSMRVGEFLEGIGPILGKPDTAGKIAENHFMNEKTAESLVNFLRLQTAATGAELPHRRHILVEYTRSPDAGRVLDLTIIHLPWGGAVTYPFSFALKTYLRRQGSEAEIFADNHSVVLAFPVTNGPIGAVPSVSAIIRGLAREDPLPLIIEGLSSSGFFGARFRENAGRALVLPDAGFNRRTPFWLLRLKSKRLLETVRGYKNFPVLLETYRQCLEDLFDIEGLLGVLEEIRGSVIRIGESRTAVPSPFASGVLWKAVNALMYADEIPEAGGGDTARGGFFDLFFSSGGEIRVDPEIAEDYGARLRRIAPGYLPESAEELVDWVSDRVFLTEDEWAVMTDGIRAEGASFLSDPGDIKYLEDRLLWASPAGQERRIILTAKNAALLELLYGADFGSAGVESRKKIEKARKNADESIIPEGEFLFASWLSYHGVLSLQVCRPLWDFRTGYARILIESAEKDGRVLIGKFLLGSEDPCICGRETLEGLLRFSRARKKERIAPVPLPVLVPFLARLGGITGPARGLNEIFETHLGYSLPPGDWETRFLPARLPDYHPRDLDRLLSQTDLEWFGTGRERIAFRSAGDPELTGSRPVSGKSPVAAVFTDPLGRYSFRDLRNRLGRDDPEAADLLWEAVWKGEIICDSFEPVRKGILCGFKFERAPAESAEGPLFRGSLRRNLALLRETFPSAGYWRAGEAGGSSGVIPSAIDALELGKDRARILFKRYGVLFRELLKNEGPGFRWTDIFPSLRIMELSGEIVSGIFFENLGGIQFAEPGTEELLRDTGSRNEFFIINARDPASLCGVNLEGIKNALPKRLSSSDVVFRGTEPALISEAGGEKLEILMVPEDPELSHGLTLLVKFLKIRLSVAPVRVKEINRISVRRSPFRDTLLRFGFQDNYKEFIYWQGGS